MKRAKMYYLLKLTTSTLHTHNVIINKVFITIESNHRSSFIEITPNVSKSFYMKK